MLLAYPSGNDEKLSVNSNALPPLTSTKITVTMVEREQRMPMSDKNTVFRKYSKREKFDQYRNQVKFNRSDSKKSYSFIQMNGKQKIGLPHDKYLKSINLTTNSGFSEFEKIDFPTSVITNALPVKDISNKKLKGNKTIIKHRSRYCTSIKKLYDTNEMKIPSPTARLEDINQSAIDLTNNCESLNTSILPHVDLNEVLKQKIQSIQQVGFSVSSLHGMKYPKSITREKMLTNRIMNTNDLYNNYKVTKVKDKLKARKAQQLPNLYRTNDSLLNEDKPPDTNSRERLNKSSLNPQNSGTITKQGIKSVGKHKSRLLEDLLRGSKGNKNYGSCNKSLVLNFL